MTHGGSGKSLGPETLRVHPEERCDPSCDCGCGSHIVDELPDNATAAVDCCEPACGSATCR
jgi:hypothetical protein